MEFGCCCHWLLIMRAERHAPVSLFGFVEPSSCSLLCVACCCCCRCAWHTCGVVCCVFVAKALLGGAPFSADTCLAAKGEGFSFWQVQQATLVHCCRCCVPCQGATNVPPPHSHSHPPPHSLLSVTAVCAVFCSSRCDLRWRSDCCAQCMHIAALL